MTAASSSLENSDHIRKLDLTRDLNAVADLIEQCFPIHLDQDGQTYIRQMRQAAREMHYLRWLSTLADLGEERSSGFIWEEDGQIIGNLSLIPFQQGGQRIHLIANVAVLPEYRRKGIARALTHRALGFLRRRHEPRTWLQVRENNPAAQTLYRTEGFKDIFVRTTWRIRPKGLRFEGGKMLNGLSIRRRNQKDWRGQRALLLDSYPPRMRWNLAVDFNKFEPGGVQWMSNFLEGVRLRHWTVEISGKRVGSITWQKTNTFANNLWLAFRPEFEEVALPWALAQVVGGRPTHQPLSVEYPSDRSPEVFEKLGFQKFRTLIWMVCELT
jgi:GNAT superfamily N-acetyltransferase